MTQSTPEIPIPEWHRDEIEKRIAAADANPGSSIPLETLRRELLEARGSVRGRARVGTVPINSGILKVPSGE